MRCGLTTPPFMQVLPIKRRNSCGIGARYCDALCAAMITQILCVLSCSFRFDVPAIAGGRARASCTRWCGDTRALCAPQWFGLGDEFTRLSFERSGTVLCADPPTLVCTAVANCCYLHAGCCRTVCMGWCKTSGKVHRSFEIQTAWSICTAARAVLRKDAHQMHAAVDSGSNEIVHQMCELLNYGRVLVATEVMALWLRSGDGRTLRTHAPLAMERRTIHSGLSFGREESR